MINHETKRYLMQTDPKPGGFFSLRKMHKQGDPGHPIVSSNSRLPERISEFVDYHIKPVVQTTQSFIKETRHLMNVFMFGFYIFRRRFFPLGTLRHISVFKTCRLSR